MDHLLCRDGSPPLWLWIGCRWERSVAAGDSGPPMSRAAATAIERRSYPPMILPTATAVVLSWLSRSVLRIRRSPVLLLTLGKRLPLGAGRTPPTVRRATENAGTQGGGWSKTQLAQGVTQLELEPWRLQGEEGGRVGEQCSCGCGFTPRRRTHYALGLALGMERRFGSWSKAQFAQGVIPGKAATRGNRRGEWRGTQSDQWLCRKPPHQWKLRCNGKRPAWHRCPTGACQCSGAATFVESYAAAM